MTADQRPGCQRPVTGPRRPAAYYLHALDAGPVVVVPAWAARWLELHTDIARQRINRRGEEPAVDEVLLALHYAATHAAASDRTSVAGSVPPRLPEVPRESSMSVSELAEQVGITGRAVRQAITAGRLHAHRSGHRYLIDGADAETYRRARRAA